MKKVMFLLSISLSISILAMENQPTELRKELEQSIIYYQEKYGNITRAESNDSILYSSEKEGTIYIYNKINKEVTRINPPNKSKNLEPLEATCDLFKILYNKQQKNK